jgi:hypothetical protein
VIDRVRRDDNTERRPAMVRGAVSLALFAALASPPAARGAEATGGAASELSPSVWLNTRNNMSWKALNGRLVLVEKWATW